MRSRSESEFDSAQGCDMRLRARIITPCFAPAQACPHVSVSSRFLQTFLHTFISLRIPCLKAFPVLSKQVRPSSSLHRFHMADAPPSSFYRRKLPDNLIDLTNRDGKKRFQTALLDGNAEAFFPLVSQLQTQSHPAFCGLTTLSVVLNALGIDPKRVWTHPWRWFAESLLDCCLDIADVKTSGMTIDQLAGVARCQGSVVRVMRNLNLEDARDLIKGSVRGHKDGSFEFVAASYDRKALGQTGTGHFSPIAAYDGASDSVLVLDVARFKYGPHWVPLQGLVDATNSLDPTTGLSRGFITFRKTVTEKEDSCIMGTCEFKSSCSRKRNSGLASI